MWASPPLPSSGDVSLCIIHKSLLVANLSGKENTLILRKHTEVCQKLASFLVSSSTTSEERVYWDYAERVLVCYERGAYLCDGQLFFLFVYFHTLFWIAFHKMCTDPAMNLWKIYLSNELNSSLLLTIPENERIRLHCSWAAVELS